jgi:hypothetical protein
MPLLVELGLLALPVPLPVVPAPDVRFMDWQPVARMAASASPSSVAGRIVDLMAIDSS